MLLHVDGLTKQFGAKIAVNAISLTLDAGEAAALIGLNGAGKTSVLRMMAGVLEPDAGTIHVDSIDMAHQRRRAQSRVGYLPQGGPVDEDATVAGHLEFFARAYGLTRDHARHAVSRIAGDADLGAVLDRRIAGMEMGVRRRIAIAAAVVHDPALVLLDEPMGGLDPLERDDVSAMIARVSVGRGVLISTHRMEDAEALCARAVMLHGGIVMADAPIASLVDTYGSLDAAFRARINSALVAA